jgi:hypothetical protein
MKVGTKSVLFGAHCFLIHPLFVLIAWSKLYNFPYDPRLWVAFLVHDLGYWKKPNMDGPEGETHVELGAKLMGWLFDNKCQFHKSSSSFNDFINSNTCPNCNRWANFSKYHSRFYAKKDGAQYSKLCVADKLAVAMEPAWLYLPRVILSGEINEYMKLAESHKYNGEPISKYEHMKLSTKSKKDWFYAMTSYLRRWAYEHKDMKEDMWTTIESSHKLQER